ncbi:MAG: type II toxin-antitoxin system prevent-host-death family antitoxin [Alkalispirochaeta sp.]
MHTVTIHEAKATLSRLIEEALSGQEVVIARRNTPLVRIVPLEQPASQRRIGSAKGKIQISSDFDELPEGFEDYV